MLKHQVTIICNVCGTEYMLPNDMELPPLWIALQIAIADTDGCIPDHERDNYCHFCSTECLKDFAGGDDLLQRISLIEQEPERLEKPEDPDDGMAS